MYSLTLTGPFHKFIVMLSCMYKRRRSKHRADTESGAGVQLTLIPPSHKVHLYDHFFFFSSAWLEKK